MLLMWGDCSSRGREAGGSGDFAAGLVRLAIPNGGTLGVMRADEGDGRTVALVVSQNYYDCILVLTRVVDPPTGKSGQIVLLQVI